MNVNQCTYVLYVVSFFTGGILSIVPIIVNYMKRKEANGTWIATHFDWQIKTFWYSLVWGVVAAALLFFAGLMIFAGVFNANQELTLVAIAMGIVGVLMLLVNVIWHLYRIIRGWIALNDGRPVP